MSSEKQNSYIEGINATEEAYDDILSDVESLRSILDMSYTEISSAIFLFEAYCRCFK